MPNITQLHFDHLLRSLPIPHWVPIKANPNDGVTAMYSDETGLYIGGRFTKIGSDNITHVAHFDGVNWNDLKGEQVLYEISGVVQHNGLIFACNRDLVSANGQTTHSVTYYDGTNWIPLTDPPLRLGSQVYGFVKLGGDLYIYGLISDTAGETGILKWDGSKFVEPSWTSALAYANGSPWAGTTVGSSAFFYGGWYENPTQYKMVEYDGSSAILHTAENPEPLNDWLSPRSSFHEYNGQLAAFFTDCILYQYDGANWSPISDALGHYEPLDCHPIGTDYYIVGNQMQPPGVTSDSIAKFNGTNYEDVLGTTPSSISLINEYDGVPIIGGFFDYYNSAGDRIMYLAKYIP